MNLLASVSKDQGGRLEFAYKYGLYILELKGFMYPSRCQDISSLYANAYVTSATSLPSVRLNRG